MAGRLMKYLEGPQFPSLWASPWGCFGVLLVAGGMVAGFPRVRCTREHGEAALTFGTSCGKPALTPWRGGWAVWPCLGPATKGGGDGEDGRGAVMGGDAPEKCLRWMEDECSQIPDVL